MLLKLPQVTLLGIDCIDTPRIEKALASAMRFVDFADVVMLVSPGSARVDQWIPNADRIRVVTVEQGGRLDYERSALDAALALTSTPHVLFMEWDSRVANPLAWDPAWLSYDFIGAPWPRHDTFGWPLCTELNCVGNGGFSLRSRKLFERCHEALLDRPGDPGIVIHDAWLGRTMRPWLEEQGIRFAPPEIAYRFACETQYYSGQFGIHGKVTMEINGFKLCDP